MTDWLGFYAIGDRHDTPEELAKEREKYLALTIEDRVNAFDFLVVPLKDIKFLKFYPTNKVWGIALYNDLNVVVTPEFWRAPEIDTIIRKFETLSL